MRNLVLSLSLFLTSLPTEAATPTVGACYTIQKSGISVCVGEVYIGTSKRKTYAIYSLKADGARNLISYFPGSNLKSKSLAAAYALELFRDIGDEQVRAVVCLNQ